MQPPPKRAKKLTAQERFAPGLNKAYATVGKAVQPELYIGPSEPGGKNDTLYIAGTEIGAKAWTPAGVFTAVSDLANDAQLPIRGTQHTQRYIDAHHLLLTHPEITKVAGHSLGAAVANDLAADMPNSGDYQWYLFNTPEISFGDTDAPNLHKFADQFDPVAFMSWESKGKSLNPLSSDARYSVPHSYED